VIAGALLLPSTGIAGEEFKDLNAIIRSLGPVEYLPEHGGKKRAVDLDIRFALNKASLAAEAHRQLDALAAAMVSEQLRGLRFQIAGHTDASGPSEYNRQLSERRAAAVKTYLVKQGGIKPGRLETVGWGEDRLKVPFNPEDPANRRVEIVVLDAGQTKAASGDPDQPPAAGKSKAVDIQW
jgi:outer membrane protein OmpA-like peptidoglycan-associated protein